MAVLDKRPPTHGRTFSTDGSAASRPFQVNQTTSGSQASPSVQTEATPAQSNPGDSGTQAVATSGKSQDPDDVGYTKREDGTVVSGAGYVTQANLYTKAESGVAREFSNGPSEELVKKLRAKSNKKRERVPAKGDMNAPMYDSDMVQVSP